MLIWLGLDHLLQNSSSNTLSVKSFTGGVTPSLLLACIAIAGLLMLYVVVKHAVSGDMDSNAALDEESCDEMLNPEWTGKKT